MIITNNEEALRVFCEEVKPEEVNDLVSVLERELNYANRLGKNGIGLAAPQIGIAKHIAIVRLSNEANFNLINAKIDIGYDSAVFTDEGCLSFPGRVETTTRYQEVVISNGFQPEKFVATGLIAVVCQHELDHLNSILFMDRKIIKAPTKTKVGPNQLCPCGSGKKFKKCPCHI